MANVKFKKLLKNQIARFIFSAGIGFLVDIVAFYLLDHNWLQQPTYNILTFIFDNYTLALAISFFFGVVVNFLITRYLVFNESVSSPTKQFVRFVSVAIIGFFANLMLLDIFIRSVGMYPPVARVAAALSLFFASFFVHKFFSFSLSLRHQHATGADSSASN
ncbi:MAG: GtrA family protein [Mucilaginibacter sp.]|uniref:GtrA family protein n=1 Tax=Mucilaginibacter sp. TaxID=1882438 RepID=UPI0026043EB3|nr:GtrA family protein [Mucilaginibacter sp.]MDB5002722.1 GtrA family protein [Mucilaginibacter sp.]